MRMIRLQGRGEWKEENALEGLAATDQTKIRRGFEIEGLPHVESGFIGPLGTEAINQAEESSG